MSQRDISKTINEIYGFEVSKDIVNKITDKILPEIEDWKNRDLKSCYPFAFVDCMYVSLRKDGLVKKQAVYVILGYTLEGKKDILGLWINESESKHEWMNIFDEIKSRGVKDIFFLSIDGVSGLEQGAKTIFKDVIVQRCIVHLIRNSIKFVPSKDYKEFTKDLKNIYDGLNLKSSKKALEDFNKKWEKYPGAINIWNNNYIHIEQLYNYGRDIRKIMYTTNAIEAVNSSFRKVCKKGTFNNENSLYKSLYLRIKELNSKWETGHVRNWSMVLNQLMIHEQFENRIQKFL